MTSTPDNILQHTLNHLDCPACDARRNQRMSEHEFGLLPLRLAWRVWLDERSLEITQKTLDGYHYHIRHLEIFFAEIPLDKIHSGHYESYIDERGKTCNASCMRHELNTLNQILDRGHLWKGSKLQSEYGLIQSRRLKLPPPRSGEVLDPDAKERLIAVAATNPRWLVALCGTVLTLTTTADAGEIVHLHLNDVDLGQRTIRIREGLKNVHRDRVITLNDTAFAAIKLILKRYYRICRNAGMEENPEHYIFPGRERAGTYDPWKPLGSWRRAWENLREKAGMPKIRKKALRRQPITELLEDNAVSDQTVLELAGHVTKGMQNLYSEVRLAPKRAATSKLEIPLFLDLIDKVKEPEPMALRKVEEKC